MREQVSSKIATSSLLEFLRWVHFELPDQELSLIAAEVQQRLQLVASPAPRQILSDGRRLAGTYFTCLPGRLAMLGAIRTLPDCEQLGSQLLTELVRELRERHSILQIQAAVSDRDEAAQRMLLAANFQHLTDIDQMWLDTTKLLASPNALDTDSLKEVPRPDIALQWTPASNLTQSTFTELLESTFQDSLDCPELNGRRESGDVLASFLMRRPFEEVQNWEVATLKGELVGCLMLSLHPNQVIELAYMGLVPAVRRLGLGHQMVLHAVQLARLQQHHGVVLAVDVRNKPAVKTYARCGFGFHGRLKVYLRSTC